MASITERPMTGPLFDKDDEILAAAFGITSDQIEQGGISMPEGRDAVRLNTMIKQAAADAESGMVSMRMMKGNVDVIKEAAKLRGMKYQTYIKDVAFRQACADIQKAIESKSVV